MACSRGIFSHLSFLERMYVLYFYARFLVVVYIDMDIECFVFVVVFVCELWETACWRMVWRATFVAPRGSALIQVARSPRP